MGWLFSPRWNKKSLIQDRIEPWSNKDRENDNDTYIVATCLKHCYRGNNFSGVLWTVWEHTLFNKKTDELIKTDKWIGCDLLRCDNYGGTREWGYKDMEESSGPVYYSCPLSYLEMAPVVNEGWRREVREYHARRNIKLTIGQRIKLREGHNPRFFKITTLKPLRGESLEGFGTYRLKKSIIEGNIT